MRETGRRVNPQITIMAPATRVGRRMAERLLFEKDRSRRDACRDARAARLDHCGGDGGGSP